MTNGLIVVENDLDPGQTSLHQRFRGGRDGSTTVEARFKCRRCETPPARRQIYPQRCLGTGGGQSDSGHDIEKIVAANPQCSSFCPKNIAEHAGFIGCFHPCEHNIVTLLGKAIGNKKMDAPNVICRH
jgi:hypothetical protein